jgi:hypothetical protein
MVDKFRRAFIWSGSETVQGGRCLVARKKVTRPVELGGLGILDLTTLGYGPRLRWEWQARTSPDKPWSSLISKPERTVQAMFEASTSANVGNGRHALFWQDKSRSCRVVADALLNDRWIADIKGSLSVSALAQYVAVWDKMQDIVLIQDREDKFIWKWTSNQQYSSSSAYRAFFYDQCSILGAKEISKAVAPPHCKFFIWLAIMDRCWTSARLQRHQLQNSGPCALCSQAEESIDHLVISLCVQQGSLAWCVSHGGYHLTPMGAQSIVDWWLPTRKRVHKSNRKGFDTQFAVVVWSLWLERNARVFNAKASMVRQLCVAVRDEGRQWKLASYRDLEEFIH